MGFPTKVADEVFVRCRRHCCLCGEYAGQKMELHHIKQVADGGDDSIDNCIPLCLNCHAEVHSYNPRHPKGRKFTEKELKAHRDNCYARYSLDNADTTKREGLDHTDVIFDFNNNVNEMLTWGYKSINERCPLFPGNIILVAGYTGMLKSTYLYHIVNSNIQYGYKVAYCCLKDKPFDVSLEVIAESAHINAKNIKRGILSEFDWNKLSDTQSHNNKNMVLIPYNEIANSSKILSVVENAGADIVVIDDLNGIKLEDDISIEEFLYKLKSTAAVKGVIVFVIYNIQIPKERMDMRPMLKDFPSDDYYRLFDIIHLLFTPKAFYEDFMDNEVEVIIVKGMCDKPTTIRLVAPPNITGIFEQRTS